MGNRTIALAALYAWHRDVTSTKRSVSVSTVRDWIATKHEGRGSSLPQMLVSACALAKAKFSGLAASKEALIERVYQSLRSGYLAKRGLAEVKGRTRNRLHALAKFSVDSDITSLHPLPKLFLENSNDLRVSLPPSYLVTMNGSVRVLVLHYDDKAPLTDPGGITTVGSIILGGLDRAFVGSELRDEHGEPFVVPAKFEDVVVVDVARQLKGCDATIFFLSSIPRSSLSKGKKLFGGIFAKMSSLFGKACKKLGISERVHFKPIFQDNEPTVDKVFQASAPKPRL